MNLQALIDSSTLAFMIIASLGALLITASLAAMWIVTAVANSRREDDVFFEELERKTRIGRDRHQPVWAKQRGR